MKKIAVTTVGCRFNQFESAELQESFPKNSYEVVSFDSDADIYVINTCTVTRKSDLKCRQLIRKAVERGNGGKVIVTGCYAETNPSEIKSIEGVSLIVGNPLKSELIKHIEGLLENDEAAASDNSARILMAETPVQRENYFNSSPLSAFNNRTVAYLKIQTGCDMNCSFCIVTKARGASKSDSISNACKRAEEIVAAGFKEIVLTGINLGCYGRDLSPSVTLVDMLDNLVKIKGLGRLRLSSINPNEVTPDLVRFIRLNKKICRHLHIPLQSGDDDILNKMRRNYTSTSYKELVNTLVSEIPEIGIGVDVIAGFPGESEAMFENTYNLIKEIPISYLHVFTYSSRKGTDAASFDNHLPRETRKKRANLLIELGEKKRNFFMEKFLNSKAEVLFEYVREKGSNYLKGYTDNYVPVFAEGSDLLKNRIIPALLTKIEDDRVKAVLS